MLLLQTQSSGEAGPPAPPSQSFCLAVSLLCPPQEVVWGRPGPCSIPGPLLHVHS